MIRAHGTRRVLIVCPISVQNSWANTLMGQFPSLQTGDLLQTVGTYTKDPAGWGRMMAGEPGVFIIGWEAMRGAGTSAKTKYQHGEVSKPTDFDIRTVWKKCPDWDYVIADEVHRVCNPKTSTYKALKAIKTGRRLGISGTPSGSAPQGLYGPISWLWPERYKGFWAWATNYLNLEITYVAGRTVKKFTSEKWPGSTFNGVPNVVMRKQHQVFNDLPEVIENHVHVPMTAKQTRLYQEFQTEFMGQIADDLVMAPLPIEVRTRLRTVALAEPTGVVRNVKEDGSLSVSLEFGPRSKSAKLDYLADFLEDFPEDQTLLCLTHSSKFARLVESRLDKRHRAVSWTGSTSKAKRAEIMQTFGTADGPRVLIAVISAIGEGTDGLQRVCHNEVWLSQEDRNVLNQQALGRLNRSGQAHRINRWYLISEGTIDTDVYNRVESRTVEMKKFYGRED